MAGVIRDTPIDTRGLPVMTAEKSSSARVTLYSFDWSDPTTWYAASTRVENEVATTADQTVYTLAHANVIDVFHGRITQEDFLRDGANNSYRVVVKVNDVTKTEQDPHTGTGGDYTINYEAGAVTFLTSLAPEDVVTVTYYYAASSTFIIKPAAGKKLIIDLVEVQFSLDTEITDSVLFQPYGYVEVFAPQYSPVPYPAGTKIPLGNPFVYKGMRDFMNDAVRAYVRYPAIGGESWRGLQGETLVLDWDYVRATVLEASKGMEIRISLQHDTPYNGSFATATFYCGTENE